MKLFKVLIVLLLVFSGCSKQEKEETVEIIENDVYWKPGYPTNLISTHYNAVSESLQNNDEVTLAKNIAIAFASDFFTFYLKTDENCVGGMTYIPEVKRIQVKEYFTFYFYKNYNSIKSQYGEEDLPEVKNIVAVDPVETIFNDEDLGKIKAYDVRMTIAYKDSEVPENALKTDSVITVAKYNNVWNVVEIK